LEGKQIWYITAPASVSIDTIKDMSLRGARSGKIVLSQKGNEYGFVEDTTENKTYTKLMLPNKAKNGYRTGMLSRIATLKVGVLTHINRKETHQSDISLTTST
jgi:hypothetical protein